LSRPQVLYPEDLLPFTRKPLFLIVDSDNSVAFKVIFLLFYLFFNINNEIYLLILLVGASSSFRVAIGVLVVPYGISFRIER